MIRGSSLNPPTCVLPFEMFRSFAPAFDVNPALDKNWPLPAWTPLCDIYETDKEIVLTMELPEMHKEDVHVTFEHNALTLRGKRRMKETVNRENYHRIERKYGEFLRIFTLPTVVEGSRVTAEFKDGMLTVTLPKNEAAIPRQIEVRVR